MENCLIKFSWRAVMVYGHHNYVKQINDTNFYDSKQVHNCPRACSSMSISNKLSLNIHVTQIKYKGTFNYFHSPQFLPFIFFCVSIYIYNSKIKIYYYISSYKFVRIRGKMINWQAKGWLFHWQTPCTYGKAGSHKD